MILSAGKFFKNLFKKKQRPHVQEQVKDFRERVNSFIHSEPHRSSRGGLSDHNMKQNGKAKRKAKRRKANKLARKQRKLNVKGGKS